MLTVMVPFRNAKKQAANCLASLAETVRFLGCAAQVEFIFTDDASETDAEIVPLLQQFRAAVTSPVTILRFKERQHYSRACAHGFSRARGEHLLLISHDMLLTPDCVQTLLGVAALDARIGIVRATSPYVDCFPHHVVASPLPLRSLRDVFAFARFIAEYHGLHFVEDPLLTGDVMLVKRAVFDKIGVMDPRYYGYFGDIDFGLRCQRAGFQLVCAKGAWLYHEGAASYVDEAARTRQDLRTVHAARMQVVNDAYKLFREKWDPSLPPNYTGYTQIDFAKLRGLPSVPFDLYQPPVELRPEIGELICS
jgi:GT2 family glycosyltransferase